MKAVEKSQPEELEGAPESMQRTLSHLSGRQTQ